MHVKKLRQRQQEYMYPGCVFSLYKESTFMEMSGFSGQLILIDDFEEKRDRVFYVNDRSVNKQGIVAASLSFKVIRNSRTTDDPVREMFLLIEHGNDSRESMEVLCRFSI